MSAGIIGWLLAPERGRDEIEPLVSGFAERLVESGIPLFRMTCSFRTLHAEVWVRAVTWMRGKGAIVRPRSYEDQRGSAYIGSTVEAIHSGKGPIRVRFDGTEVPYPQLKELVRDGATDYVIHPLALSAGIPTFASFTTDRPGGFTEKHLASIEEVLPALRIRVELASLQLATRSLLHLYLGANAASRVLAGGFRRATGEDIDAVIWTCDMRGFTSLADERKAHEVVETLDSYFDCVAGPLQDAGGEVLKFVGDAVLAILPVEPSGAAAACRAAVRVAEEALEAIDARNGRAGEVPVALGIGIHRGVVTYGNIGARDRLDFTVIGRAVNEASRVESLCKELEVPVIVTDTVASSAGREDLVSLGRHSLRGVRAPRELFTLERFRKPAPRKARRRPRSRR